MGKGGRMTAAYAYLRVSGRSQIDGDGFARQIAAVESYAAAHDIEVKHVFEERGVSGKTEWDDRPAWVDMIQRILANGVRTIIIERLDRLARELMVQEHIIADLRTRGIALISVAEPDLDSDDPTRVLMRQIMGAIAQFEKQQIVAKLRGARQRMKAKSGRCEGIKPFGHYHGESETLAVMKSLADGRSLAAVARELNLRQLLTRGGKPWHPHVVARILKANL